MARLSLGVCAPRSEARRDQCVLRCGSHCSRVLRREAARMQHTLPLKRRGEYAVDVGDDDDDTVRLMMMMRDDCDGHNHTKTQRFDCIMPLDAIGT